MAKKSDQLAARKAKKQKTILIVGGVLLLGVAALQGPKLMKKDAPEAAPATTTESSAATGTTGTTETASGGTTAPVPATPVPIIVSAANTGAVVAGVALPREVGVRVAPSQLASFTLFAVKDPFVQPPSLQPADSGGGTDASSGSDAAAAPPSTPADDAGDGQTPTPPPPPPPVVYATIDLDGKPQQLQVKQKFPESEPLFVLRSLTKKQAKIGVAGGSFDDGQAVTLAFGRKVTLVNTATGVRYVLKLVYTGSTPEVIEGFTAGGSQPAAADAAGGASSSTSTDAG